MTSESETQGEREVRAAASALGGVVSRKPITYRCERCFRDVDEPIDMKTRLCRRCHQLYLDDIASSHDLKIHVTRPINYDPPPRKEPTMAAKDSPETPGYAAGKSGVLVPSDSKITITVPPAMRKRLVSLLDGGLFGRTVEEAAERGLAQWLDWRDAGQP